MTFNELTPMVELEALALDPLGPRVVAIGGGHGLAAALAAVQSYASHITAVVSVADDGGSSGRLTAGMGIPPVGDIRRCLLALTPEPTVWSELFSYRFEHEEEPVDPASVEPRDVSGHSLGNLILAALADLHGDFARAVEEAGRMLNAVGRVLPAASEPISLSAIVGGRRIDGQVAVARARGGVEQLILGPERIEAHPDAIYAIESADQIVLGPGSLFTSVMAALVVPGMVEAVDRARGRIALVLNLVTQDGETLGMSGREHVSAFTRHAGLIRPGGIVAHRGPMRVPEGHDEVVITEDEANALGWTVHHADVADHRSDWPTHDPIKLGRALAALA